MSTDWPRFGGWYPLDEDSIDEKVDRNLSGVYKIRIRGKKRGSEAIQGIKCGQIIYIGSSCGSGPGSGIRFRLMRQFKSNTHTNDCVIIIRNSYHLEFSIKVTESEDVRDYEEQELDKYKKKFGELPLCNSREV